MQGAFDQADQEYRVRMAKAEITARLLSRSPGMRVNHPFNLTVDIFYFDQCCAKNPEHESRNGNVVIVIYELMNNNIKPMSKI